VTDESTLFYTLLTLSSSPPSLPEPPCPGQSFTFDDGLKLDCGLMLAPVTVAYQTYGALNADKSNAILICHALTGDQFAAGTHPVTGRAGWWHLVTGPGLPIDTDKYFVICSNVLGGCSGTTGPRSVNPTTGKAYGLDFPSISIGDMVAAQARLVTHLGITRLFAVVGGSMGGMQALMWASRYPRRMGAVMALACSWRHTAQNIAFHEVGRQAIMSDPDWRHGRYYDHDVLPRRGLAVARMAAHVTYMSEQSLHTRFGRKLQDRASVSYGFEADFQIESYLRHQGQTFVNRFDANSYLYITRAVDYFDLSADHGGQLARAFAPGIRYCIVSFSSDWLFPRSEARAIVRALNAHAATVSFVEIATDKGHDAFLHQEPEFHAIVSTFLAGCARQQGGLRG
jgi:homoserine O-acetyltransferase/O-succinyltransferase